MLLRVLNRVGFVYIFSLLIVKYRVVYYYNVNENVLGVTCIRQNVAKGVEQGN